MTNSWVGDFEMTLCCFGVELHLMLCLLLLFAAQYVLLGADEGLFSLQVVASNPDPVMEQVSLYVCWFVGLCMYVLV